MTVCSLHHCPIVFVFLNSKWQVKAQSPCYKNKQYTNSGYALVGPKALLYINPHKESFFLFFISQFFYGMKSVNFIFVNQHTTQNFTIQRIQQKVLFALVRFVKFKSSLCWEGNPFFGTSWIFGAWWIALGQVLTSRKSLKTIPYPIQPQRLRLDLVFRHQICSVPAHKQKLKIYQRTMGEFVFHLQN